jgi:alanine dehydrogenase
MLVGVPKEIKDNEFRVGMTPATVAELTHHGHSVLVETSAGLGSGLTDDEYRAAGAAIVDGAAEIFARAEMIVKVKEPQANERRMLRSGQTLFTYLHLAPDRPQTEDLIASGAVCIAYETVTSSTGGLLGGVPGAPAADVVIIGGGVSGANAATIALGMGAHVTILDRSIEVLRRLAAQFDGRVQTIFSTRAAIAEFVGRADMVIGAVLVPGASAPKLITREMLGTMKPGSVIVDIAIDQGGCAETSRPTTHSHPTYVVDGVVHYCVANMPGAVARTSTFALNNATLPFTLALANKGWRKALSDDPHLRAGLNICAGHVTCEPVAIAHGLPYLPAETMLS